MNQNDYINVTCAHCGRTFRFVRGGFPHLCKQEPLDWTPSLLGRISLAVTAGALAALAGVLVAHY